jgi:hypothetical protein
MAANRLDPFDSLVFVAASLEEVTTGKETQTRLQQRAGRPLERWACRIVERESGALQSGVHVMRKAGLAGRPTVDKYCS